MNALSPKAPSSIIRPDQREEFFGGILKVVLKVTILMSTRSSSPMFKTALATFMKATAILPFVGACLLAGYRAYKGYKEKDRIQYVKAVGEVVSGVIGYFPGMGILISLGLDSVIVLHGLTNTKKKSEQPKELPKSREPEIEYVELPAEEPQQPDSPPIVDEEEPPVSPPPAFELHVTEAQGNIIREIITTVRQASLLGLGWNAVHLRNLGAQLEGLGPLLFLAYIFSQDDLKKCVIAIKENSLKWNRFIADMGPKLTAATSKQHFYEDLPRFAKSVGVEVATLEQKAKAKDWDGFVSCLVA